jgi:Fibronectin type III domain
LPLHVGAPVITGATPGVESITLVFSPPSAATDIFDYRATCFSSDGGVSRSKDQGGSPIVLTGLTTDKTYSCTVMAENSIGFGPPSAPSAPVVTLAPPGPPAIASVTAGSRNVTVSFSPPASDGGTSIFDYQAFCASSDGGVTRWIDAASSPIVVNSLSPGNTYTCTVTAKNSIGYGPPSTPSAAVVTLP